VNLLFFGEDKGIEPREGEGKQMGCSSFGYRVAFDVDGCYCL